MGKKRGNTKALSDEIEDILSRPTAPVERVWRAFFGFGREASRSAAKRGEIITKKFGNKRKRELALTAPLRALLSPDAK